MKMVNSRSERYQSLEEEIEMSKEKIETLENENVFLKNIKNEINQLNHEVEKAIGKIKGFE